MINKMKLNIPPLTDHQKLIIDLHEQGHIYQNKINKVMEERSWINVDTDLPVAGKQCLVKLITDNEKKKTELDLPNEQFRLGNLDLQDETIIYGIYEPSKEWRIMDFKMNPSFQKVTHWKYHESEQDKEKHYFDNFPFDEQAVRDFLCCMKELGYFKKSNPKEDKLSYMLSMPNSRMGFRLLNVTVGIGTHETKTWGNYKYEVKEDEVYVTYDTTAVLSGGKYTYVMQRKNGENKIIKSITHSMS